MKINVYVFLFNGFADWEIGYLTPELAKSDKVNLKTFTLDGLDITSAGGLIIIPNYSLKEVEEQDISLLVLPGGSAWEAGHIQDLDHLVNKLLATGKVVAAICGATFFLAQKGLLNKVKHTSNDLNYLKQIAPEYQGENYYEHSLAVSDAQIITAAGIAPIEFAKEIFLKTEFRDKDTIEKWYQLYKHGIWSG